MYMSFPRGICNSTRLASHNVSSIFGNRHLSFRILSDLSCVILPNPEYRKTLKRLGFRIDDPQYENTGIRIGETDRYIRGQIARLLLTPNGELCRALEMNLNQFGSRPSIGIQLRMGGSVSKTMENHRFLYLSSIPFAEEEVKYALKYLHADRKNTTLFVTTDSILVRTRLFSDFHDMHVLEGKGYAFGHSSAYFAGGNNHLQFLKRAIIDLVLASHCDYIIFTRGSSYGQLAMRLGLNTPARDLCRNEICSPFVY